MEKIQQIIELTQKLTGQTMPFPGAQSKLRNNPFAGGAVGYSQFNELLLTLGYDRVTPWFFARFFGEKITSIEAFEEGIRGFLRFALLFGNVKFAFKRYSSCDESTLESAVERTRPLATEHYEQRNPPLHAIQHISAEDAYYLGYLVFREVQGKLNGSPKDPHLLELMKRIEDVRRVGMANHEAYRTYDHMDVYIATSMRERYEFYMVNSFVRELFIRPELESLKLRWFDPTQAFCEDRIDKGLVEALMLKRAKCTIYHAQEGDTLGKDSELAATLAQGKTVIAYVPRMTNLDAFRDQTLALAKRLYPEKSQAEFLMELLHRFCTKEDWNDPVLGGWLRTPHFFEDADGATELIFNVAREMYDKRAQSLSEYHPLAIQVNIDTGVANGVLVVRSVRQCADLLRSVVLNTMEFAAEERTVGTRTYLYLREKISNCIYRVVTGDELLTNSFWNFYLKS